MKVLVVGSGAREHALAWKLGQSALVEQVFVAPGNAGTAAIATNLPIPVSDLSGLADAALSHGIDFTIVGPEDPLANGIVDLFQERGLAIFGPRAAAARIESSKSWAKDVMQAAGVPTARADLFTDLDAALEAVSAASLPVVIKASGLAAGKGVVVATTRAEAEDAVREMLERDSLGDAGHEVLIEEFLEGQEVSVLAITDGTTILPLVPACDYKRLGDDDTGPNTGGMGAYAPVPAVADELLTRITSDVFEPTLAELNARGVTYQGVLYAGLILTSSGPKVLEFNCRLGDPETEVVLRLLRSDLAEVIMATIEGRLAEIPPIEWHPGVCVGVVMASGGYPGPFQRGKSISGLDQLPDGIVVFHAGTAPNEQRAVETSGGRVLAITALGRTFREAREQVYEAIANVQFDKQQFRRDIAAREVSD